MSSRIQVLTHKGKKIIFADSSNLTPQQIVAFLPEITKAVIGHKCPLLLQDVTGTSSDDSVKKAAIESVIECAKALGKEPCSAFIGMRGLQKIIANAAKKGQYFADTKEEALDWLVSQD